MNPLSDYIVERIRIDNIKFMEIPIDKSIDEILIWMKDHHFKNALDEYPNIDNLLFRTYVKKLQKIKDCIFNFKENNTCKVLRFVNTTENKISNGNPVFVIFHNLVKNKIEYYIEYSEYYEVLLSKSEFIEKVNKIFHQYESTK